MSIIVLGLYNGIEKDSSKLYTANYYLTYSKYCTTCTANIYFCDNTQKLIKFFCLIKCLDLHKQR